MFQDTPQRKLSEEAFVSSGALVTSTLDALSAQVAILDDEGIIVAVNERWRQTAVRGHLKSDSYGVGSSFFEICKNATGEAAGVAKRCADLVQSLIAGERSSEPIVYCCDPPSGPLWYQLRMTRFEDHGAPRIVLAYEDVSELMGVREELRHNQERLHLALEAAHITAWEWDLTTGRIYCSDRQTDPSAGGIDLIGGSHEEFLARLHPGDRPLFEQATRDTLNQAENFSIECRVLDRQNVERWVLCKGHPIQGADGRTVRVLGVNVDVTDLKLAQLELRSLAERLIQAQEEERKRISRELHDDIGQRLALLAVSLSLLREDMKSSLPEHSDQIEALQLQTSELITDTRVLSHQLHSSKLEYLGLKSALKELCGQISVQHSLSIQLEVDDLPILSAEVQLCLYRITQEALRNVVKHSGASRASVSATENNRLVALRIADLGAGFDPRVVAGGLGFGIMRERLRIVGGMLSVKTCIGQGTEITAEVPVGQERSIATAG